MRYERAEGRSEKKSRFIYSIAAAQHHHQTKESIAYLANVARFERKNPDPFALIGVITTTVDTAHSIIVR